MSFSRLQFLGLHLEFTICPNANQEVSIHWFAHQKLMNVPLFFWGGDYCKKLALWKRTILQLFVQQDELKRINITSIFKPV